MKIVLNLVWQSMILKLRLWGGPIGIPASQRSGMGKLYPKEWSDLAYRTLFRMSSFARIPRAYFLQVVTKLKTQAPAQNGSGQTTVAQHLLPVSRRQTLTPPLRLPFAASYGLRLNLSAQLFCCAGPKNIGSSSVGCLPRIGLSFAQRYHCSTSQMNLIFNIDSYYSHLKTKRLGRPCIYLDQVSSTIDAASSEPPDTIVLAKEQLNGRGQRGNVWQSPLGCAMASLRFSCPKDSYAGSKLCFLQHIMVLVAAKTLEQIDNHKLGKDRIKLKWPNDIHYKDPLKKCGSKIGGVLVNTKDLLDCYDITLSFGLNVFNQQPTTCISDILGATSKISIDYVVARMMNNLEQYLLELDEEKFLSLKLDYTDRCIHMNKYVEDEIHGRVRVKELNDDGYLLGERSSDGRLCIITKIISFDW